MVPWAHNNYKYEYDQHDFNIRGTIHRMLIQKYECRLKFLPNELSIHTKWFVFWHRSRFYAKIRITYMYEFPEQLYILRLCVFGLSFPLPLLLRCVVPLSCARMRMIKSAIINFFSFFRACAQHAIVILYLFCLYINFQIHWQYLIWFRLFCKAGNRHKTRADELLNISGCDSLMKTDWRNNN